MRLPSLSSSDSLRSINLAISARGIYAIRAIDPDVADRFLENVIPMKGRMIHDEFGRQQSQLYDRDGQVCNFMFSCSRFLTLPSLLHLYFRVSVFTHAPFEL